MALPQDLSTQLVNEMDNARAVTVMSHVEPVRVAAMLGAMNDTDRQLLAKLSPSFRIQVMRQMRGDR
jgi:Mg/Co/Ni transporter MgtE